MTASISDAALADLIAGLAPKPAVPARRKSPCDDPFCSFGNAPCGWEPVAHAGRSSGGQGILATPPAQGPIASMPLARSAAMDAVWSHPDTQAAIAAGRAEAESSVDVPATISRPASPPPSTVAEMRDVLTALDANRPRSLQRSLGPSELGTPCQRQIAMKVAGLPRQPEDKRPPWAPMQGTAMHTLMEEALRFHNQQLGRERWIIEERLEIDPGDGHDIDPITGHGDAFDTDTGTVVDWKYVGVTTLRDVKRKTIPNAQLVKPEYRVQGHTYGYGHERAGRRVEWVRLVFLARSHDYADSAEWTERYDPNIAIAAVDRFYATHDLINNLGLVANPALWAVTPAAPGKACDWCPFRRPGGPADGTGCPGNTQSKIDKQVSGLIA
jgi:hypothetical protein